MHPIKYMIFHTRRLSQLKYSPSASHFARSFTSDSINNSNPYPQPQEVKPVSYTPKPKESLPESETEPQPKSQLEPPATSLPIPPFSNQTATFPETRTSWSREDARYLKDAPSITPVSYPSRVAPLPDENERIRVAENAEVIRESAAISRKRAVRIASESEVVPFPRLIMPTKKEKKPLYELSEAIKQVKANARKAFDETLEAHAKLGVEKSRSDLIVRGTMTLPHGEKKVIKVAVFAEGGDAEEARAAGADIVGGAELIDEIASTGKIDFDKCYTTRQMYPRVAKVAKILNRLGLMPDAKQGTVVSDVAKAVKAAKKNQVKFRMDKSAIVHAGLGKLSFSEEALRDNVGAFMDAILQAKPAGLKKASKFAGYVTSFHICSTMGQGFPVSIQSLSKAVDHYHKHHLQP